MQIAPFACSEEPTLQHGVEGLKTLPPSVTVNNGDCANSLSLQHGIKQNMVSGGTKATERMCSPAGSTPPGLWLTPSLRRPIRLVPGF